MKSPQRSQTAVARFPGWLAQGASISAVGTQSGTGVAADAAVGGRAGPSATSKRTPHRSQRKTPEAGSSSRVWHFGQEPSIELERSRTWTERERRERQSHCLTRSQPGTEPPGARSMEGLTAG